MPRSVNVNVNVSVSVSVSVNCCAGGEQTGAVKDSTRAWQGAIPGSCVCAPGGCRAMLPAPSA